MWLFRLLLIIILFVVFFQDYKDRLVHWFLFPLIGILAFIIQIQTIGVLPALANAIFNLAFILIIIFVCFFYAKLKLKKPLLKEVLGIGDVLFFIFIALAFSIISFLVLFVFSLLFSLLMHLFLRNRNLEKTVPLAGYMALFFGIVFIIGFICDCLFLYAY